MRDRLREFTSQALADASGKILLNVAILCVGSDLLAYVFFGSFGLFASVTTLPAVIFLWIKWYHRKQPDTSKATIGLDSRSQVEHRLDQMLSHGPSSGFTTVALVLRLDGFATLCERLGHRNCETILRRTEDRLSESMRRTDMIARFDGAGFALALSPVAALDLETAMQIAARLHKSITEPLILDGVPIRITGSIGMCLETQLDHVTGPELIDAAEAALVEAARNGPGATRAYSPALHDQRIKQRAMIEELQDVIGSPQIRPWFQPQVSTDTGEVSGFEALIRWEHPLRGLISPADFLPAIEKAGLSERLGDVVLDHALNAIKAWDHANIHVPSVGINLSKSELENPNLKDKIAWQLDRFDLAPERLTIEILETVIAGSPDDVICQNIRKLADLGCRVDLDDFGTGHASITSLRQFPIDRIKIDRAFVTDLDKDPDQQRMIATILTMAENLGLETLAEGVETPGEHAMTAQLGCVHVQGFGIGRPMPFEDTTAWLTRHAEKLPSPPNLRHSKS